MDLPADCDVSRETQENLRRFATLLETWTKRINLISPSTIAQIWERHILDSLQFWGAAPHDKADSWCDLGTGAGLPGMIIAIIAADLNPSLNVTLLESDQRKCAFLRTAAAELALKNTTIIAKRIEQVPAIQADIISARALAPLPKLLQWADRHLAPNGTALYAKGEKADMEIKNARTNWTFDVTHVPSITSKTGTILRLERIARA